MRNEMITVAPRNLVPGMSNLSLVNDATTPYPEEMGQYNNRPRYVVVDLQDYGIETQVGRDDNGNPIFKRLKGIEIDFRRSSRSYSAEPGSLAVQTYRTWRFINLRFDSLEPSVEGSDTTDHIGWAQSAPRRGMPGTIPSDNFTLLEAFRVFLSGFSHDEFCDDAAAGRDPIALLRGLTETEICSFVSWLFCHPTFGDNYASQNELSKLLSWYREECNLILEGRTVKSFGISNLPGAGRIRIVVDARMGSWPRISSDVTDNDFLATVIDVDGVYHAKTHLSTLGLEFGSPAYYAVKLGATSCSDNLLRALNARRGVDDTFGDVMEHENGNFLELCNFLGTETVTSAVQWAKLLTNYRNVGGLPVVISSNFEMEWITSIVNRSVFTQGQLVYDAMRYGQRMEFSAVDIEEFARTAVPENELVRSVTMMKNGRVRVVLREPVYPEFVLRRGVTYTENEPGTVLSYMAVHAFDLDFRGTLSQFPNATAYEDEECTRTARHTNITSSGHVCLGDINTEMSEQEISARGGMAMPCVGDFVQMLRQCNLDSAYYRNREFVLADPNIVTDDQWNAKVWNIPGLRRVDQHMDDFKAFLASFSPAEEVDAETE